MLDLMERRETAQASRDAAAAERDGLAGTAAEVTARRDAALSEIADQAAAAEKKRAEAAAQEPADLLAFYDKLRAQHAGVGAAALRQGRCEGCRLSFSTSDLNAIRAADAGRGPALRGMPPDPGPYGRVGAVIPGFAPGGIGPARGGWSAAVRNP